MQRSTACPDERDRKKPVSFLKRLKVRTVASSMVKMSLDPVQVMAGQVEELKVAPSANGDSRGSFEAMEEFDQDHLGLTTKPKPVSPSYLSECVYVALVLPGAFTHVAAVVDTR